MKMEWYLLPWKRFAEFGGRSRRKEYWMFTLFNMVIAIVLTILSVVFRESGIAVIFSGLSLIYGLAAFIPGLAVTVRRLHDTGKSGWWVLIALVPLIGLVLIVFMVLDSDPAANQYGPNPKLGLQAASIG
jgi:uncharacterized membrane protein YhaH (DUF805 family)